MVINSDIKVAYRGDGQTTVFPFSFPYFDKDYICVRILDEETGESRTLISDYYVDTQANTVHYPGYTPGQEPPEAEQPPILPATSTLTIYRSSEISQLIELGQKYPLPVIESALDKITHILQEHDENIKRSIKTDITSTDDPQSYFDEIIETAKLGLQKATEAIAAAEAAEASETAAAASATAAAASAASMDESVATCTAKAAEAAASAASIDEAAQTAAAKATEAAASATAAAGSATAAAGSAATAQSSASAAAGSATAAATSETNATTAATSATTAKTAAETAANNAAGSATAAANSATSAADSVASIGDSVETAQQAAQDAQDAASSIGDAEETCTTAATNASASATAAANSATSAAGSATSAANSADEVEDAKEDIIALAGGKFGFRQPNTAYGLEDTAYFTMHMNIWYIECVTAGTTGSGDLVITNPQIDQLVTDGTVTWQVRKQSSTGTGTETAPGLTKLYNNTGNNTDGTMTQAAISTALSGVGVNVSTLQTQVGTLQTNVGTLQTNVGTLQTNVGGLQTDMTTAQGDIDNLEGDVSTLQTDMGTAQNDIVLLGGDVGSAQSNIGILQNNMTTAQGNIGTLQTSMATAQTDITNLQSAMSMTYKAKGSIAFADLPATLTSEMLGWVYNIYDDITTDSRFVEGAGNEYFAGENVAVVEYQTGVYKLDVLSGYIDLSAYPHVVSFDSTTSTLTLSTQ